MLTVNTVIVMVVGMSAAVVDLPRTAARSEQLIAASERATHDPFTEVDWDAADRRLGVPPAARAARPLRHPAWEAMDEARRIEYSRHEAAAVLGAGIWFENALMQIVLRHLLEIDVTDPMHRYLLIEIADECRHSAMFGEYIRRAGTPSYGPDRPVLVDGSTCGRALGYLLVLAVEEQLDHINRRDHARRPRPPGVAPDRQAPRPRRGPPRQLRQDLPGRDLADPRRRRPRDRDVGGARAGRRDRLVDARPRPCSSTSASRDGAAIARANPHHRANVVAGLAKLTSFLDELGVITDRPRWSELGLVDAA